MFTVFGYSKKDWKRLKTDPGGGGHLVTRQFVIGHFVTTIWSHWHIVTRTFRHKTFRHTDSSSQDISSNGYFVTRHFVARHFVTRHFVTGHFVTTISSHDISSHGHFVTWHFVTQTQSRFPKKMKKMKNWPFAKFNPRENLSI